MSIFKHKNPFEEFLDCRDLFNLWPLKDLYYSPGEEVFKAGQSNSKPFERMQTI